MAQFQDYKSMFEQAVDEYLETAEWCLGERRRNKSCFGYSATLLIFCAVEAMGRALIHNEVAKLGAVRKNDFRMLAHEKLGVGLSSVQITNLAKWYRNNLAHTGVLIEGIGLSPEPAAYPFEFCPDNEPRKIYVRPFFEIVQRAWKEIDHEVFDPAPTQRLEVQDPLTKTDVLPSGGALSYIPGHGR
jgi:hypothetical protein